MTRTSMWLVALVLLVGAMGQAIPPPTISKDAISPDAPPEVRQAIEQLYGDSMSQSEALEGMRHYGREAAFAMPFLASMLRSAQPGWTDFENETMEDVPGLDLPGLDLLVLLSELGPDAWETLSEALRDKNPNVRAGAAYALGQMQSMAMPAGSAETARAWELLAAALETQLIHATHDPDPRVRGFAVRALFDHPRERVTSTLVEAAHDSNASTRAWAAAGLAKRHDPRALGLLVAVLAGKDSAPKWTALIALQELGDRRAVEPLLGVLKDDDTIVREDAAEALGAIGDRRAVPALIKLLRDKDAHTAAAAAAALGRLRDDRAFGPLLAAYHDTDRSIRKDSLRALGGMHDKRALAVLLKAMRDADPGFRAAAATGLGMRREAAVVDLLTEALGDPITYVRAAAAQSLGEIRALTVIEPLAYALAAEADSNAERAMISALGHFGADAFPTLEPLLQDPQAALRRVAAFGLGSGRVEKALEPLAKAAASDPNPSVRLAALWAVWQMDPKRAISLAVAEIGDENEAVRQGAQKTLPELTGQHFGINTAKWQQWWAGQPHP